MDLQVVLLSGGSGKRLWPLSNEVRSKAFLKLLPKEGGGVESMIERVCRGLAEAGLLTSCCIVTHRSQVEITRKSVGGDIPVLAEPLKRGTFTAVALAASYLHSVRKIRSEEIVVVIPVDSYVEASFFKRLQRFPEVLGESGADLALLGAAPQFPSTQFGYILPKGTSSGKEYLQVAQFSEKPDEARADYLISQGGLWNCGVFSCSLRFLLSCLEGRGLTTVYQELLERYTQLSERSFDREVLEKTERAVVIPYTGQWADIGSWDALTPFLHGEVTGLGTISADSVDTHLVNELSCPVHVIGAPGLIVAAGPDGILVAGKEQAKRIKEELEGQVMRPMIEEKRWGCSRILDCTHTAEGTEITTSKVTLLPGRHTSYHFHPDAQEMWSVLSGSGEYIIEGMVHPATAGDMVTVLAGARHLLRATTQLELIVVEIALSSAAEDIVRIADNWEG
ncbi:cupin domain-containing protein [Paenibacillus sp. LC-T2]|uniref:Cupin domain-containing protein n=1 Tax=Paenibacillus monticola TaxID=2666075 RepID=A0A7X2H851_9BACL|nr:cupin domain-containing protein [Paenibacillus monticola]